MPGLWMNRNREERGEEDRMGGISESRVKGVECGADGALPTALLLLALRGGFGPAENGVEKVSLHFFTSNRTKVGFDLSGCKTIQLMNIL